MGGQAALKAQRRELRRQGLPTDLEVRKNAAFDAKCAFVDTLSTPLAKLLYDFAHESDVAFFDMTNRLIKKPTEGTMLDIHQRWEKVNRTNMIFVDVSSLDEDVRKRLLPKFQCHDQATRIVFYKDQVGFPAHYSNEKIMDIISNMSSGAGVTPPVCQRCKRVARHQNVIPCVTSEQCGRVCQKCADWARKRETSIDCQKCGRCIIICVTPVQFFLLFFFFNEKAEPILRNLKIGNASGES